MATTFKTFEPSNTLFGVKGIAAAQASEQIESFNADLSAIPSTGDFFDKTITTLKTGSQGAISSDLISEGFSNITSGTQLRATARTLDFNAKQIELKGQQASIQALEAFNAAQASNIVRAFASGVRLSGSITVAQEALGEQLGISTGIQSANTRIKAGALKREAKRLRAEAEYNQIIGPFKIIAGAAIKYFSGGAI